jgi:hypothetical protein
MGIPRILRWLLWATGAVFLGIVAFGVFPWVLFSPSEDEVARVTFPKGDLDAVLMEINGGATTSFGYNVIVVKRGARPNKDPVARLYGAVRNEHAYGLKMRWEEEALLVLEYMEANSALLAKESVSVGGKLIRVAMKSGVIDPSAPSGGMLFNLRGRQ